MRSTNIIYNVITYTISTGLNSRALSSFPDSYYVLEGLKPQTMYEFRFAARNDVGLGNWGALHREMTPGRTVPNEPKIVMSREEYDMSRYSNQYELTWLAPADNGEPIDMYQIKYCQIRRVSGEWETLEDTCRTEDIRTQGRVRHWLRNLYSDTFYKVELKAHNAIGFSKPGSAKFKTARGEFPPYSFDLLLFFFFSRSCFFFFLSLHTHLSTILFETCLSVSFIAIFLHLLLPIIIITVRY